MNSIVKVLMKIDNYVKKVICIRINLFGEQPGSTKGFLIKKDAHFLFLNLYVRKIYLPSDISFPYFMAKTIQEISLMYSFTKLIGIV